MRRRIDMLAILGIKPSNIIESVSWKDCVPSSSIFFRSETLLPIESERWANKKKTYSVRRTYRRYVEQRATAMAMAVCQYHHIDVYLAWLQLNWIVRW